MGPIHDQHLGLAGANELGNDQLGKHGRGQFTAEKALAAAVVTVYLSPTRQTTGEFFHIDRTHLNQRTHQPTQQVDIVA